MPSCFGSLIDITLRVRNGLFLSATRTFGTCSHKWRCFFHPGADTCITRCLYTKKMDVHFHLHRWVSPITTHSVLPFASGHVCREHKKTRWLVSLWGTGFPCSRDKIPSLATVILFFFPWLPSTNYYVPLIEHSDFILGILTLPSALSRLFWQPTLGVFSQFIWLCIQLQCRSQICILRSVHRQNKCLKLQRSLRG